jgi:hypothetical protein
VKHVARGIYRHFKEVGEADIWRARVETSVGQWTDVERADYESAGYQPAFWDLPLEEDHIAAGLGESSWVMHHKFETRVGAPLIVALMIGAGVIAVFYFVGAAILTRLGLL